MLTNQSKRWRLVGRKFRMRGVGITTTEDLGRPKVREEVIRFSENRKALVLGHKIDPSAIARLQTGTRDDYARFSCSSFLFGPPNLQTDLRRQIDTLTADA